MADGTTLRPVQPALSQRELDVLAMTARGLTNNEVGTNLNVTVHAVKFHLASIYRKLNVANRTEAAAFYFRTIGDPGLPREPS